MKKYALSLLTLSVALSSGAAFAAVVGDAVQQNVDITFNAPGVVEHNITPVGGLEAGSLGAGITLANGSVRTGGDVAAIEMRFTNAVSTATGGGFITGVFKGSSDESNTLKVKISGTKGSGASGGTSYVRIGGDFPSKDFEYDITSSAAQTVAADTYTVSVTAQSWES